MAPDAADAAVIVREAARRKRILTVYQPRRATAYFQQLKAIVASGIVGDLYHVRLSLYQFSLRNDWQALRKYGGGMLNNYGAHALDQVLQLVGYDVKRVFCSLRRVASVGDAEDVVKVVLETAGGAIGEVDINQAAAAGPGYLRAWGTRGAITLASEYEGGFTVRHLAARALRPRKLEPSLASAGRRYPDGDVAFRESIIPVDESLAVDVYADLARAIRTGRQPFVRPEEPLALMRLIDRCRAESGRHREDPAVQRAKTLNAMDTLLIGSSGMRSSRLVYGCMRIVGDDSPDWQARGKLAIRAALEAGFTHFDHADIYGGGRCEELFAEVLRESPGLRHRIVITSKCGIRHKDSPRAGDPTRMDFSREYIERSVEGSLGRLGVEHLDILLLHRPDFLFRAGRSPGLSSVCSARARCGISASATSPRPSSRSCAAPARCRS